VAESEGSGHLQAVPGEMADSAAFEDRDQSEPPDAWAEECEKATPSQTKGSVKLAVGIGNSRNVIVAGEVADFRAALEHVDEHNTGTAGAGLGLDLFQASEDLAGEGAAEMPQKHHHEKIGGRCFSKRFSGR